jgi:Flp pilus assembly protein TadG
MRTLSSSPCRSAAAVRRRGSAIVFVAILASLLIGLLLLSLDTAHVRLTAQELQRAADAGALAGAEQLAADDGASNHDLTRTHALDCALANTAARASVQVGKNPTNDPAGDVVLGRWDRVNDTFRPTTSEPDAVKVVAQHTST